MRRMIVATVVVSWAAVAHAGIVSDFGDILFWAGSGTNQAALVLDFGTAVPQGAPQAVAWGYRWNGAATLQDMVFGLAGTIAITGTTSPAPAADSDPRLGVDAGYSTTYHSYFVNTLAYDQVGLPAGWSQGVRSLLNDFDNDVYITQYERPSAAGVWPAGSVLDLASLGLSDTALASGGWYGYVAAPADPLNFYALPDTFVFAQPTAAVPEPSTAVLLAGGAAEDKTVCLRPPPKPLRVFPHQTKPP
ncbi:MAG: hypothetical protein ACKOZU_01900, partial [Planctomycetaceae bacterium]